MGETGASNGSGIPLVHHAAHPPPPRTHHGRVAVRDDSSRPKRGRAGGIRRGKGRARSDRKVATSTGDRGVPQSEVARATGAWPERACEEAPEGADEHGETCGFPP